jgi:hypothetical protein
MSRIEHNDPGSIEVRIVRRDKGLMWLLLGRIKQFATPPLEGSRGVTLERSMVHEIGRETIGTEVSNPVVRPDEPSRQIIFAQFVVQPCSADLEVLGGLRPVPMTITKRLNYARPFGLLHRAFRHGTKI